MQPSTSFPVATWVQLRIAVPARLAEDAAACLIDAGALGVITQETADCTQLLVCYGAQTSTEPLVAEALATLAEIGLQLETSAVEMTRQNDADWAQRWKQYFKPVKLGRRIWIVPSWDKTFESPTGSVVLTLDPGTAFGTGQHASTALCIRAIELFTDTRDQLKHLQRRVLDVGCGTGILGLTAAKLGATDVLAIDNDPQAVDIASANAISNHVAERMQAKHTPLSDVAGTFELVVANILAQTLIDMAPALLRRMAPKGGLLLSGILREQADHVISQILRCADRMGVVLRHDRTWTHGEWVALQFLL